MKHTPGPWRNEGWGNLIVNSAEGYTILACPGGNPNCPVEELQANARLIAAAPEMLETLEHIRDSPEFELFSGNMGLLVIETIAKAKGR